MKFRIALFIGLSAFAAYTNAATNRPSGYTTICKTNETCSLSQTTNVAYGASGLFTYKVLSGSFVCNTATFGVDPNPAKTTKECSIPSDGSSGISSSSVASSSIASSSSSIISSSSLSSSSALSSSSLSSSSVISSSSSSVASSVASSVQSSASDGCGSGGGASVCLSALGNNTAIALSWSVSGTITSAQIYRDTDPDPSGRVRIASLDGSARSYADTSALSGTTYYYWVKFTASSTQYNSGVASAALLNASACAGQSSGVSASKIYYVSPTGSANASGTSFSSPLDLTTALNNVGAGQMILLQPGTYSIAYSSGVANTIKLTKSGSSGAPINMVAADCGRALLDFSFPDQDWVQDSFGLSLTGSYWYFKGIEITRAGYQGVYVTGAHNTFENCAFHHNRNTGLEINKGGSYTTVINSDAYRNYDPKKLGSMADGFGPKQTQGPGNSFIGCRAWENSDDGFDMFDSPEAVVIKNSWAFRNGVDVWGYGGFAGNGNGFKLGGNSVVAHNEIYNSVAFDNPSKGFDQNNNAGGLKVLNCTAYRNGINFGLGNPVSSGEQHYLRNNVSLSGSVSIANADAKNNSWDSGPAAIVADFASVDVSLATAARNTDGSLPENNLFRLTSSSALIDKGVNVGLPYLGGAPDLGAFEKQ